ncbi:MAG: hypothetical protein ABIJ97_05580 [Bacteroidota bacterium]
MKNLLTFTLSVLLITISISVFSQTWDKKSIEKRKTEILYVTCKGGDITQNDFTDLFVKGLLESLVNNCNDSKDVEHINMIIDNSRRYFDSICEHYNAIADSVYQSRLMNIKADSLVVVPKKTER